MVSEKERTARKARAEARRARMTIERVSLGQPKPSPYANATPEERVAAAVRLIAHQQALLGHTPSPLSRAEWPGDVFVTDFDNG